MGLLPSLPRSRPRAVDVQDGHALILAVLQATVPSHPATAPTLRRQPPVALQSRGMDAWCLGRSTVLRQWARSDEVGSRSYSTSSVCWKQLGRRPVRTGPPVLQTPKAPSARPPQPLFFDTSSPPPPRPSTALSSLQTTTSPLISPPDPIPPRSRIPPKPTIITTLLLQAIFLGATVLGALSKGRRQGIAASEAEHLIAAGKKIADVKRAEDDASESWALNLLLASYVAGSGPLFELRGRLTGEERVEVDTRVVEKFVGRFRDRVQVDRTGVLAMLHFVSIPTPVEVDVDYSENSPALNLDALPTTTFVESPPPCPSELSRYELLRPVLMLWAWRNFQPLLASADPQHLHTDLAILSSFLTFVSTPPSFAKSQIDEIRLGLDGIVLSTEGLMAGQLPASFVLTLGRSALQTGDREAVLSLLLDRDAQGNSRLLPRERLLLSVESLDLAQRELFWHGEGKTVRAVGVAFLDALKEVAKEGMTTDDVELMKRAVRALIKGFAINVPMEDIIASSVLTSLIAFPSLAILTTRTRFIYRVLNALVAARHSARALEIFQAIPLESLTTQHFKSLLRSSHAPTSQIVWNQLLSHPILVPSLETYSARMSSHTDKTNNDLISAHTDLESMERAGIPRTTKEWNLLLNLYARVGTERSWRRMTSRLGRAEREGRMRYDRATHNIILCRAQVGRVGLGQIKDVQEALGKSRGARMARSGGRDKEEDGVGQNIAIRSMVRSQGDCRRDDIVRLVRQFLFIDLETTREGSDFKFVEEGDEGIVMGMSEGEYEVVRRPRFAMFAKALWMRGEVVLRRKLLGYQQSEVWERRLEERRKEEEREERRRTTLVQQVDEQRISM